MKTAAVIVFLTLLSIRPLHAQREVASHFGVDSEGWSLMGTGGVITWFSTGGNPSGHITIEDTLTPGAAFAYAPAKFQTDLTPYDGGTLSIDLISLETTNLNYREPFGRVKLTGPAGSVTRDVVTIILPDTWTTFSIPFDAAAWGLTQAQWTAIIGNIGEMEIEVESWNDTGDIIGMDNFVIAAPPPTDSLWLGTDNIGNRLLLNTDKTGRILREYGPREVTGIAIDPVENLLYLSTSGGSTIDVLDIKTLETVGSITQSPNAVWGEDITFDGAFLYRVDLLGSRVQRVDPATGAATNFITGLESPLGITWSGTFFYVSLLDEVRILQFTAEGTPTGVVLTPTLEPGDRAGGLAWDPTDESLWLGSSGTVYHLALDGTVLSSFETPPRFVDGFAYQASEAPCLTASPDAQCSGASFRAGPFPLAGLDDFPTGAAFKVQTLDGTEIEIAGLSDAHTIVGRSDPFYNGDPEEAAAVIAGGGQPPYEDTAATAGDPCVTPSGFPENPVWGHEIHTQILSLDLIDGMGNSVKAGQPYFDSVEGTPQEVFYRNSLGEVQGLDNDFPADSYFNVFVEVTVGPMKLYNKSPMLLRGQIDQFPPDLSLPRSVYIHDPSFGAVPLFDESGIHVAYLLSAGHGSADVTPPPEECEVATVIAGPLSFAVDEGGSGTFLASSPNHVEDDEGLPVQQLTGYVSSGGSSGSPPDTTNARIDRLVGNLMGATPPAFAAGDAIRAMSHGRDGGQDALGRPGPTTLLFSVDRDSRGASCTSVRFQTESSLEQAADVYAASASAFGAYGGSLLPRIPGSRNALLGDQTTFGLRPLLGEVPQDNLTGLESAAFGANDLFFGAFTGPSFVGAGATVYVYYDQGDPVAHPFELGELAAYATTADLGLVMDDSIDAIVVSDESPGGGPAQPNGALDADLDEILFSLSPASPTLFGPDGAPGMSGVDDDGLNGVDDFGETGLGDDLSPADILHSSLDGTFTVLRSHVDLGLLPTDNVDALDIGPTLSIDNCNCNDVDDACDIARGFSQDCNTNSIPDECERVANDCDCNDTPDECDPDGDLDEVIDACDSCPEDHNPFQEDFDNDSLGDACDPDDDNDLVPDLEDCKNLDPLLWGTPGETTDMTVAYNPGLLETSYSWTAPLDVGGQLAVYDALRSSAAGDFSMRVCVESNGSDVQAVEYIDPTPGSVWFILNRAENNCPDGIGLGSLGASSPAGEPRVAPNCP